MMGPAHRTELHECRIDAVDLRLAAEHANLHGHVGRLEYPEYPEYPRTCKPTFVRSDGLLLEPTDLVQKGKAGKRRMPIDPKPGAASLLGMPSTYRTNTCLRSSCTSCRTTRTRVSRLKGKARSGCSPSWRAAWRRSAGWLRSRGPPPSLSTCSCSRRSFGFRCL